MKKILISTLMVLFLVTSCGKVPKLKNGEEAVVTIKNGDISVDSFYEELKNEYGIELLMRKIDTQILNEKYPENDDEKNYVKNQIESIKYYYENYYKSQYKSYEEYLTSNGIESEEELEKNIALNYKRDKATEDYAKTLVTEKEIKKYYQDEIFGDITASHILIKPDVEDTASDEEKSKAEKKALKEAKDIIEKLKKGEKFEDLAKKYSDDTSNNKSGGKLVAFNHGQMVKEFEKAAKDMKTGTYSTTPVKTEYGYHIIYKTAQKEKPKLEEVKDDIIDDIAAEKQEADKNMQVTALLKLRETFKVEIQDKDLKKAYDSYITRNS